MSFVSRGCGLLLGVLGLVCSTQAMAADLSSSNDPAYKQILADLQAKGLRPGQLVVGDSPDAVLKAWGTAALHEPAKFKTVNVMNQPFQKAIQVDTPKCKFYWSTQLQVRNTVPVKKGDLVYITFWARNLVGGDPGRVVMEAKGPNGYQGQDFGLSALDSFERWHSSFSADRDLAPGELVMHLMFGEKRQIVEIGGFAAVNMGQGVDRLALPARPLGLDYEGREADAAWRKEAFERIEKIRKGDLSVNVVDAAGKPVPNAQVKIEMKRHAFMFGCGVPLGLMPGSKVKPWHNFDGVANASAEIKEKYRQYQTRWFNTTNGPSVWAYYKGVDARYTGEDIINEAKYWRNQGMRLRNGQTVYPRPEFTPPFANELMKQGKSAEFAKAIRDWQKEAATTFGPFVDSFQIANEFEGSPYYTDVLGGDPFDWIATWFKQSKEFAPKVQAMINDPGATPEYFHRIQEVLKRGGPIEAIGLQNHSGIGGPSPIKRLKELDQFAVFKLPLEITEMEVTIRDGNDAKQRAFQADYFRDQLIAYFSHPAVHGVILQDFWEGAAWQTDKFPSLISKDFKTVYPHGKQYEELVRNKWWTNVQAQTKADGSCATRGFLGDYEITATANGKTTTTKVSLPASGAAVKLTLN